MIYTWRCKDCNKITEVERAFKDYDKPPEKCESCKSTTLSRVILEAPSTPFQQLRQSGMFADDNGNFAPRKV